MFPDRHLGFFRETPQNFSPGSVFNYEHSEHLILDRILTAIEGKSAFQLAKETIFDPLGLVPVPKRCPGVQQFIENYRVAQDGHFTNFNMPPMCSFWEPTVPSFGLTLPQIAMAGQAILSGRLALSNHIEEKLETPYVELPKLVCSADVERFPHSYGLSCGQFSDGVVGHNASTVGQTCALRLLTRRGVALAVGTNCWAPHVRDAVVRQVLELVGEAETPVVSASSPPILGPFAPTDVRGTYIGSYFGAISITAEGTLVIGSSVGARSNTIFSVDLASDHEHVVHASNPTGIAFFPSPDDGEPCLAFGAYTYKRRSDP